MKKKTCVFIVIASPSYYYNLNKIILLKFMNSHPEFETLFVYGKVDKEKIIKSKYDLYFDKIEENYIPGIFIKSIEAIKYINLHYDYQYIIRTNLSTFWRLDKLYNFLQKLPSKKYCGGAIRINSYRHITGSGIIMSKDICLILSCFLKKDILKTKIPDDVLFTEILNKFYKIDNSLIRDETFMNKNIIIKKDKTNINLNNFYFRLKTKNNRYLDHIKLLKMYLFFYKNIY